MTKINKTAYKDLSPDGMTVEQLVIHLQEEFDPTAIISSWGDGGLDAVSTRLETDEEYAVRLQKEEEAQKRKQKSDFELYLQLKKQFEVKLGDLL
jgi:hypothetical protein